MKRLFVLMACFLLWSGGNAWAGDRVADWTAGGAIGGALLGQVIGGDTRATIVGAAAGGVLGYVIGSDQERYRYSRPVYGPRYDRNDGWRTETRYVYVYDRPRVVVPRFVPPPPRYWRGHGQGWNKGPRWKKSCKTGPAWERSRYGHHPVGEVSVRGRGRYD